MICVNLCDAQNINPPRFEFDKEFWNRNPDNVCRYSVILQRRATCNWLPLRAHDRVRMRQFSMTKHVTVAEDLSGGLAGQIRWTGRSTYGMLSQRTSASRTQSQERSMLSNPRYKPASNADTGDHTKAVPALHSPQQWAIAGMMPSSCSLTQKMASVTHSLALKCWPNYTAWLLKDFLPVDYRMPSAIESQ